MSFGENLQFLRKKNNITQEQLAEQLGVSRQSVSKWESDGSYPEMDKLMQLCEMFSCNMDALLRGNVEEHIMEDTAHYDAHMNDFSKWIAGAVGFLIFNAGLQCILEGLGVAEEISQLIFFIFAAISVIIFVVKGIQHDHFKKKNPSISQFYTEDVLENFAGKFPWMMAIPVGAIIIGVASEPLLEKIFLNNGLSGDFSGGIFLWVVAAAVTALVYGGMQKSKYSVETYNKENEYNKEQGKERRATQRKIGKWCGVIMLTATILFLLSIGIELGDYQEAMEAGLGYQWKSSILAYSWIVFPVGGILCGIVAVIFNSSLEEKEDEE